LKVLYLDQDMIVLDKDGEKLVIYPYCGCNSGFWYLQIEELTKDTFDGLSLLLQEKLRKLGLAP